MKVFIRSKNALSSVVASIILVAVAVAISLATAGWLGGLTTSFEVTEQIEITSVNFTPTNQYLNIVATNFGADAVIIKEVWVNNVEQTNYTPTQTTVPPNAGLSINVTLANSWVSSYNYQIRLVSSRGNQFLYVATAP